MIRLQHLLVAGGTTAPIVVKHWRQDWVYEPESVLVATAPGSWRLEPVAGTARAGRWSQTVWQTDDSPRYGAIGTWRYDGGVARWTSDETRRPLARRDAIRNPPYDHYQGVNRHALTPGGWVHEQDNRKLGTRDGALVTYVHEAVVNSYRRFSDFPVSAADDYWEKTSAYWADVRHAWGAAIIRQKGIRVIENAENGSQPAARLMGLASEIADGTIDVAAATAEARRIIAAVERGESAPAVSGSAVQGVAVVRR